MVAVQITGLRTAATAGKRLDRSSRRSLELGAAGAGTTNRRRSHPAAATAACSLSKASGVQPVATKMLSVASDKVNR